jgi:16S rRNA (guanine1207-N2)-methyltransferase
MGKLISATINNVELQFQTTPGLFSPDGVDRGTLAMLSVASFSPDDRVLDLGCGYGAVSIYAAKIFGQDRVVMSDVDETCAELAKMNAALNGVGQIRTYVSDGLAGVPDKDFTLILSNPPYHADFSIPKHFIEKGFNRLAVGGKMLMVTKRKDWYQNKLRAIFGGSRLHEIDGYFVFEAEKRSVNYANARRAR